MGDQRQAGLLRSYVGGEEFGEVCHMGALALVMPQIKSLHVTIMDKKGAVTFEQMRRFLEKCGAQCTHGTTDVRLSEQDKTGIREHKAGLETIKTRPSLQRQLEYGLYDFPPHLSTQKILEIGGSGACRTIQQKLRNLSKDCDARIAPLLAGAFSSQAGKKVMVWVRDPSGYRGERGMSTASLTQIIAALKELGLTAVLIGKVPADLDASAREAVIDISSLHAGLYTDENTFFMQSALYHGLLQRGVVAQLGMQSGGMDFAAFSGIKTLNIHDASSEHHRARMRSLAQVSCTQNIPYNGNYDASKGQALPPTVVSLLRQGLSH